MEKLVSDPYLIYLANKNMFKLNYKGASSKSYQGNNKVTKKKLSAKII